MKYNDIVRISVHRLENLPITMWPGRGRVALGQEEEMGSAIEGCQRRK